ncbi:MAG: hypothetical protein M1454_01630 [Candidatus Thermoplasmatota archaeon]|nr:hypothetical protein [Candidatus Thermoplasmatota archaeon]MCL5730792.1 hypothetical protein [Candidatus Thermoplasmatota archaeon]
MKQDIFQEYEKLNKEILHMRKEIDDMKEVIKGLIRILMSREDDTEDDDYN